jgi:hypothetical protein
MNCNHECRLALMFPYKAAYRSCISQVPQKDCVTCNHQRHQRHDNGEIRPLSGQAKNSGISGHSKHNDIGLTNEGNDHYVSLNCIDTSRPNPSESQPGRCHCRSPFVADHAVGERDDDSDRFAHSDHVTGSLNPS